MASASIATSAAAQSGATSEPAPSRADLFLGYSYLGTGSALQQAPQQRFRSINSGGTASATYYFTRRFGVEVMGGIHEGGYDTATDQNDSLFTISAGPVLRLPYRHVTLFGHLLGGAGNLLGPNSNVNATFFHNPYTFGPSAAAGGGVDLALPLVSRFLSYRLIEADYRYVHADFGPYTAPPTIGYGGGSVNLNAYVLSTGLVFHALRTARPPAVLYSCSASAASVYPGDPVTITGTATNLRPRATPAYTWAAEGGAAVAGTGSIVSVPTQSLAPGNYTVRGHVSDGSAQMADCAASFSVLAFEPPTLACTASPAAVNTGETSTITALGRSPQNRGLSYSYQATSGTVAGTGATATLSTAGDAPGKVSITCSVVDDRGMSATAETQVEVLAPAPAPSIVTSNLCTLRFTRDPRRPTRVDNEMKACLDDVALQLEHTPQARLALTAEQSNNAAVPDAAAERAVHARDYLVESKRIDTARIALYTTSEPGDSVVTTLIPAGAELQSAGWTVVPADFKPAAPPAARRHR